jgi:hypothetical protein
MNVSLSPVPSQQAETTCAHCGAALVADQRYCLACGQPCSPVRLAFLDVLQGERNRAEAGQRTFELSPTGYVPAAEPGASGWLRRYSGLLSLFTVLLACLLVGLLIGHWVTQSKAPGQQVIKVEGLPATVGAAAPATASTPTPTSTAPASSAAGTSNAKAEAEEAKEAAKETKAEKAPPPAPVKANTQTLSKLTNTKGAQHQAEINKLIEGGQPIETGH